MKKTFTTLFFASLCLAASAQGLKVTVDGQPVENGATVSSNTVEATEADGKIFMWELKPETHITVTEQAKITVTVTNVAGKSFVTYKDSKQEEAAISFCGVNAVGGMPGMCTIVNPGNSETMDQTLDASTAGELQCYFMSNNFENPVPSDLNANALVKIEAEGASGKETFEFTLNMVYPGGGANAVETIASAADFHVEGGRVIAEGEVEVYDLAGARVSNDSLSGAYIVRVNGRTAKIVVK